MEAILTICRISQRDCDRFDRRLAMATKRYAAMQSGTAFADIENSTYYRESYDDRGQLQTATGYLGTNPGSTSAPLPGRSFKYGYDAIGNRTSVSWTGSSGTADVYSPNSLNQYDSRQNHYVNVAGTVASDSVSVTASGGTNSPAVQTRGNYWFTQLTFDNASQPKQGTVTITALLAGDPNVAGSQYVTAQIPSASQSFTYDADGNLLTDGMWTYQWDAENRLTQMSTSTAAVNAGIAGQVLTFQYDYLDRRVQKRVTNTAGTQEYYSRRYLYDGWNLVAEFAAPGGNSCGSIVRSYTWGLDLSGSESATGGVGALLQIADYATGKNYLPTYDTDGNVAALINASDGTVAVAYEYSPYGELLRKTVTDSDIADNVFQFSSKFTDKESSLVYYGHRYYSPSLGRFINRDPVEESGGINLYGFALNDPVDKWDVLGNTPIAFIWAKSVDNDLFGLDPSFAHSSGGTPAGGSVAVPTPKTTNENKQDGVSKQTAENGSDNGTTNHTDAPEPQVSPATESAKGSSNAAPYGTGPEFTAGTSGSNTPAEIMPTVTVKATRIYVGRVTIQWIRRPSLLSTIGYAYAGRARFKVPPRTSGIIIQRVTINNQQPYWELWIVENGKVIDAYTEEDGANDVFGYNVSPSVRKPSTIAGKVEYFENATRSDFPELVDPNKPGHVPYSMILPSSYSRPRNWDDTIATPHSISESIDRQLSYTPKN